MTLKPFRYFGFYSIAPEISDWARYRVLINNRNFEDDMVLLEWVGHINLQNFRVGVFNSESELKQVYCKFYLL